MIAAQGLKRRIGIERLVVGIAIDQWRRLIGQHLAQDSSDRLALGEPLPTQAGQDLGRRRLVERDEARHPAIGEVLMVERVENAGAGGVRETKDGQRAQMLLAQHRLQPADERRIHQNAVEIHRRFRNIDGMALCRNRPMQEGQRLSVIERADLGQEAGQKVQYPLGLLPKAGHFLPPVPNAAGPFPLPVALQQRIFCTRLRIGRRHIKKRQVIAALEMLALTTFFEGGAAFLVHQP